MGAVLLIFLLAASQAPRPGTWEYANAVRTQAVPTWTVAAQLTVAAAKTQVPATPGRMVASPATPTPAPSRAITAPTKVPGAATTAPTKAAVLPPGTTTVPNPTRVGTTPGATTAPSVAATATPTATTAVTPTLTSAMPVTTTTGTQTVQSGQSGAGDSAFWTVLRVGGVVVALLVAALLVCLGFLKSKALGAAIAVAEFVVATVAAIAFLPWLGQAMAEIFLYCLVPFAFMMGVGIFILWQWRWKPEGIASTVEEWEQKIAEARRLREGRKAARLSAQAREEGQRRERLARDRADEQRRLLRGDEAEGANQAAYKAHLDRPD